MKKDFEAFQGKVQHDKDGNPLNPIRLEGVSGRDVKAIADKLSQIADNATTHGEHYIIGELYGFKLLVKTDDSMKEGMFLKENKFFVEGEGNIKYTYNNGHLANDPKLAVSYFLHALEKIPVLIEKYEKETVKLSTDLPVLREVVGSVWRKEEELKGMKSELAALDRKILLSLHQVETLENSAEERETSSIVSVKDDHIEHLQETKIVIGHIGHNSMR
jgi:hypothetical protein